MKKVYRKLALINYLLKEGGFTQEEIKEGYDSCIFLVQEGKVTVEGGAYMVLNEHERNEKAKEYIQETLEVFRALSEKCEAGNDATLALVEKTCGLDTADGYGHFLASYDGKEGKVTVEGEELLYLPHTLIPYNAE